MKKKAIVIVLAILILGGAGFWISQLLGGDSSGSSDSSVKVIPVSDLQTPEASTNNRFNGVVETQKKKNITLDSEKTIDEIKVSEGDHVDENDPLFTYNTDKTTLEISQKELEKEKTNSTIQADNDKIAQLNSQLSQGNLSSSDRMTINAEIMETQTAIAQAQYDLKAADAEIATLKASVKNATVYAPMAGTIEKLADPETLTDTSAPFITIVADGDMRIKGKVSEQSIGTVFEGQQMLVRSRLNKEDTWTGTVTSLESKEETSDSQSTDTGSTEKASNYSFYVTLDSSENLMLGQHVTLEPVGEAMEGLVLPTGYIVTDESGSSFVYAVKQPGEKLEKRAVETGTEYTEQGMVQIVSGLSENEYVAWPDNESCKEGAATSASTFARDTDEDAAASTSTDDTEEDAVSASSGSKSTRDGGAVSKNTGDKDTE